ncbi:hypothetical protein QOT17_009747 [Balamuthia mandrillaris]
MQQPRTPQQQRAAVSGSVTTSSSASPPSAPASSSSTLLLQTGQPPARTNLAPVLRNLDEMLSQVAYLRAGCQQIFQGFVNLARAERMEGEKLAKSLTTHIRYVLRTIKRIGDLGIEVQPYLISPPSTADALNAAASSSVSNQVGDSQTDTSIVWTMEQEEPYASYLAKLEHEYKWNKNLAQRCDFAYASFEAQLSSQFPLLPANTLTAYQQQRQQQIQHQQELNIKPLYSSPEESSPSSSSLTLLTETDKAQPLLPNNTKLLALERLLADLSQTTQLILSPILFGQSTAHIRGISVLCKGVFRANIIFHLRIPSSSSSSSSPFTLKQTPKHEETATYTSMDLEETTKPEEPKTKPKRKRSKEEEEEVSYVSGEWGEVEYISVCGPEEEGGGVWSVSKHHVFRKMTTHAMLASHYFASLDPEVALKRLVMWLETYSTMYSEVCKGCKKHLCYDNEESAFLPPTWHTFSNGVPYHPQCRPSDTLH